MAGKELKLRRTSKVEGRTNEGGWRTPSRWRVWFRLGAAEHTRVREAHRPSYKRPRSPANTGTPGVMRSTVEGRDSDVT